MATGISSSSKLRLLQKASAGTFGRVILAGCLSLGTLVTVRPALAQDVAAAANAYSRAQKAELAGDHEAAAELYELADSLAPAPEALRSAVNARKAAGELAVAAVHAEELVRRYPDDKRSKELATAILAEAKEKLSRYAIHCKPRACSLVVDGSAASTDAKEDHILYLDPGKHDVSAMFGSTQTDAQSVAGEAGHEDSLIFEAPPEASRPHALPGAGANGEVGAAGADLGTQGRHGGLSPWLFVGGAVVTAGLGAASIWSGLDVIKAHNDYKGHETQAAYDDGRNKEKRTNILFGVTAAAAVGTGVLAILTDWSGKPADSGAAAKSNNNLKAGAAWLPGGGLMNVEGRF